MAGGFSLLALALFVAFQLVISLIGIQRASESSHQHGAEALLRFFAIGVSTVALVIVLLLLASMSAVRRARIVQAENPALTGLVLDFSAYRAAAQTDPGLDGLQCPAGLAGTAANRSRHRHETLQHLADATACSGNASPGVVDPTRSDLHSRRVCPVPLLTLFGRAFLEAAPYQRPEQDED